MISADASVFADGYSANDALLEVLLEGVLIVDRSRMIVLANESACKMLAARKSEIVGRAYDLVLFDSDRTASETELANCPINFALSEGAPAHMPDAVFVRGDGTTFRAEFVCAPIREADLVRSVVISFQDVSLRREIELALAEAHGAALEAARTKAAFLANISHEIRTPLSGIVGTANLLADTKLDAEQAGYIEMLKQSIDSLLETVNDILDFSKIEAGKLKLDPVEFDLRKLIDEVITVFRSSAESKGLTIVARIDDEIGGFVRGDHGRLRQILGNLISNAIKFTSAGGVEVTAKRMSDSVDRFRFEVSDTGIGIADSQLPSLFQPFTQGDVSTTRRFGGTGLGLAISRELVEMMDGEIGVESEPGRGSTFLFSARLTPVADGFQDAVHLSEGAPGNLRVLVAEDHAITSEIIRRLLESSGCRVIVAPNGQEAVKIASGKRFDLILMDCQMPLVDGYAAAQAIRAGNGPNRDAKIIALSAHAVEIERENCVRAGMDDFLCKPLTRDSLDAMLERHFTHRAVAADVDLSPNLIQHFLSKHVTPAVLDGFVAIESSGEANFVYEIFETFFRYSETELKGLDTDIELRDLRSIRRRAHALKGSSANVGLTRIAMLCGDLETAAVSGERVSESADSLAREIDELKREFYLRYECRKEEGRLRSG